MKKLSIFAFIPARGGSKRLPGKNIRSFSGKPLISYSIALARSLPQIDRCVVSTDDETIATVATSFGAEIILRPPELATDTATTASAARHVLETLAGQGYHPQAIVTLQPACPLRPKQLVQEAIELYLTYKPDSVLTVSRNNHKLGSIEDGYFSADYQTGIRSQDLKPVFYENGLVYVTDPSFVLNQEDLFGKRMLPLVTDPIYAMGDIDTILDFEIAEFLFKKYRSHFSYVD